MLLTDRNFNTTFFDPALKSLFEVDNSVVVPAKTHIRLIVTSVDVLACFKQKTCLGGALFMDGGGELPPSGTAGSHPSSGWTTFDEDVLLEQDPLSEEGILSAQNAEAEIEDTSSVNQGGTRRPVPHANPVASPGEEAGPSNRIPPVRPYPYQENEIIGGDCLQNVESRLVEHLESKNPSPSFLDYQLARIQAEDLFEVKVEIIQLMAGLDPTGDWMGQGARALENSRTATGEESLDRLYAIFEDLQRGGVQSSAFLQLKVDVVTRRDPDDHSSA